MGRETIEKESLRGEAAESSGKHLAISEPFGSHLGDIWEDVGCRGIWEAFGGQISENRCPSATECKSRI